MQTSPVAKPDHKVELLAEAPVVPFGTDLLHWDAPEEQAGVTPAILQ